MSVDVKFDNVSFLCSFYRKNNIQNTNNISSNRSNNDALSYSVDDLLQKADELVCQGELALAQNFLQKALEMDQNNCTTLVAFAELLLTCGDFESAAALSRHAIALEPDRGATKYMLFGQSVGGDEAAEAYARGIAILQSELAQLSDRDAITANQRRLCSAYCALAELYLTDLCMAPEAEQACGEALEAALTADAESSEALQLAASYRISCQQPEEALNLLRRSHAVWRDVARKLVTYDNDDDDDDNSVHLDITDSELELLPSYERRHDCARLYMELGQPSEAVEICDQLVQESDDVVELWALLAHAHAELNDWSSVLECVSQCETLAKTVIDGQDEELMQSVMALRERAREVVK